MYPNRTCPLGHACPTGTTSPQPCPPGTVGNMTGLGTCNACPGGFHCPEPSAGAPNVTPKMCPQGYFCPGGNAGGHENPCPSGTFSNSSGLNSPAQCNVCIPGSYCGRTALTAPEGPCAPGFWCGAGTMVPTPIPQSAIAAAAALLNVSLSYGPASQIGTAGVVWRLSALDAVLGSTPGPGGLLARIAVLTSDSAIATTELIASQLSALAGYVNASQLGDDTGGMCAAGYVCTGGSATPKPSNGSGGYACPEGHYCTVGSTLEKQCPPGSYAPAKGSSYCSPCPAGRVCEAATVTAVDLCPVGSYCPTGSSHNGTRCPAGSKGTQRGLERAA